MRPVALAAAGATAAAVRAIAAVSRDGVIGVRGKLPWRLPREWAHFRRSTRGAHSRA
mgnify:CR=1 FL=1